MSNFRLVMFTFYLWLYPESYFISLESYSQPEHIINCVTLSNILFQDSPHLPVLKPHWPFICSNALDSFSSARTVPSARNALYPYFKPSHTCN